MILRQKKDAHMSILCEGLKSMVILVSRILHEIGIGIQVG